jgi:ribosome maturation factor RimP
MIEGRKRFRGIIKAADAETVTITLPDAPKDTDPDHVLPLALLAEAKLIMTDALMDMARIAQDENDPLADGELETEEDFDDIENDVDAEENN